jgi:hypothetical protein
MSLTREEENEGWGSSSSREREFERERERRKEPRTAQTTPMWSQCTIQFALKQNAILSRAVVARKNQYAVEWQWQWQQRRLL